MIIAGRKPLDEILKYLEPFKRVLLAACNGCVAICHSGGEKEAGLLSSQIVLAGRQKGKHLEIEEITIERQCEKEFLDQHVQRMKNVEAVISLACGIGVQAMAARYENLWVFPGLNTHFMGMPEQQGEWVEKCAACGNCMLATTGGICPVACCSKSLLNGPCGGSDQGMCEVDRENIPCGWTMIYERLKMKNSLYLIEEIIPPKDWSTSRDGGRRRMVREDLLP
jgi:hypothetical protein